MPEQERKLLSNSALGSITDGLIRVFYGPRAGRLYTEAGELLKSGPYDLADAKSGEAEYVRGHISTFRAEMDKLVQRLDLAGVPLPPVEFYKQMIAPTRPISELTSQDLSALPADVLQTALDLQRVREGVAVVRIDEPTEAAKLSKVLVNSANRLVRSPYHKTRQISESNFAVLQALVAAGPDGSVEPEILTEIGLGFNKRPGAFARRTILELREILEKNPREPEFIITNRDRRAGAGPSSYTARFTLEDAKLRMPALKPAKAASSAKQSERAAQVREPQLVDREQKFVDAVRTNKVPKADLMKLLGVTAERFDSIRYVLNGKLKELKIGSIENLGTHGDPRYVLVSFSTEPAPAAAPADEVVPSAPRLTAEDLEKDSEAAELSPEELTFLAMRLAKQPQQVLALGNEADLEMVEKSSEGAEVLGNVNVDNLAVKLTYYLGHRERLDQIPSDQSILISMANLLEAEGGNLLKD